MRVTIIGKNSFIAKGIRERLGDNGWAYLSHDEALNDTSWTDKTDCVINFALNPKLKTESYREAMDIDLKLARLIANRPIHYIMASTRLLYGQSDHHFNLTERFPINAELAYSKNKLVTERNLMVNMPQDRLTILRLANVFGHELERESFFGLMLTRLKYSGKIFFNMSPESLRDFLPVWRLADALAVITQNPKPGVYNLGSGLGTTCGDVAARVMEGFGDGKLHVLDRIIDDQYWLDITAAKTAWPDLPVITPDTLREDCIACGKWLRGT